MMPRLAVVAVLLWFPALLSAAEIRGKVSNVVGGEPLARVRVSIPELKLETTTGSDGTFVFQNVAAGSYVLRLDTVGYRLMEIPFTLANVAEAREFSLVMVPDNYRRTDVVEVTGDVFQAEDSAAVTEQNLTSSEIRQASTVLADDPFRAVQSLPGVSASGNNELLAQISVMGASFDEVGLYLDDVLLPSPFHEGSNVQNGASLSLLTSEIVEDMKLLPVAYPEKFGDQIGAALDIHTRDGSRTAPLFRAAVGLGDSDIQGEGQMDRRKRGSWLASARKSYLGYIVHNLIRSDFANISFYDGDLKLSYDLTPKHALTFFALGGHTNIDDPTVTDAQSVKRSSSDFVLFRAGWRWSLSPHLLLDSRLAYIHKPSVESNVSGQLLNRDAYGEWVGGGNVIWAWHRSAALEAGWTLRRLQDHFVAYDVTTPNPPSSVVDLTWLRGNGFAQQSATVLHGRLHVLGSLRMDAQQRLGQTPVSEQASAAFRIARATELQFGFGRYAQLEFPGGTPPAGSCVPDEQGLQRSNHYTAGVEQRLGENTRIRLQGFDRESSNLLLVSGGASCPGFLLPGTYDVERQYSRGVQVILQRRSANRLSGWLGYTLVRARQSQLLAVPVQGSSLFSPYFATLDDQPNSVNAFATYRLRPTLNFSAKALYGSGFPLQTGLTQTSGGSVQPEPVTRLGPYLRVDLRADKSWAFRHWKMTLYSEVLNLTDHDNRIIGSTTTLPNGQVVVNTQRALPVTPTAGLVFEF